MPMKVLFIVTAAALVLGGCQATQSSSQVDQLDASITPASPRAVVKIDGMACPFCTYNIQRQLEALDGVRQTDVSLKKGEAYVTLSSNNPATAEQLRRAVESAGFTATEVRIP